LRKTLDTLSALLFFLSPEFAGITALILVGADFFNLDSLHDTLYVQVRDLGRPIAPTMLHEIGLELKWLIEPVVVAARELQQLILM